MVTARPLDRERTSTYSLQVRCRDAGEDPRVSDTSVRVNVVDINDNSPVFTSQTYRGTIVENNYIGASVLQVRVTHDHRHSVIDSVYNNGVKWLHFKVFSAILV